MARDKDTVEKRYGMRMRVCSICEQQVPSDEVETCGACGARGCPDCIEDHDCDEEMDDDTEDGE